MNSTRHLSSSTLTIQGGARKLEKTTSSGLALRKSTSASPDLLDAGRPLLGGTKADGGGVTSCAQDFRKTAALGGGLFGQRTSPNASFAGPAHDGGGCHAFRGAGTKVVNLVTFAAPSFSHRSAGSKAGVHGFTAKIMAEDNILEDSSSKDAIDVLGSPRQPSLNSMGTGRRTRGGLMSGLTISQGPTASDLSLLLGESRDNVSQRKAGGKGGSDGSGGEKEVIGGQRNEAEDCEREKGSSTGRGSFSLKAGCGDDRHGAGNGDVQSRVMNGTGVCNGRAAAKVESGLMRWKESEDLSGVDWRDGEGSGDALGGNEAWRQSPKPELEKMENVDVSPGGDGMRRRNGECRQEYMEGGGGSSEEANESREWGEGSSGDAEGGTEGRRTGESEGEDEKMKEKHEGEDLSVQCPHCPRRLRNAVTLQNHVRVVHDHCGKYRCGQCGLTFMWRSTLGNHVRLVHEKQRPYACEECAKAFRWKSHLREHYWVVHKGEKPFQCETCGKTFGRKNNMQKHMKKHSEPS